jgi:hypothetical protein
MSMAVDVVIVDVVGVDVGKGARRTITMAAVALDRYGTV